MESNNIIRVYNTVDFFVRMLDTKKIIDISDGVEESLGISLAELKEAAVILDKHGYGVFHTIFPQLNDTDKVKFTRIIARPGMTLIDVYDELCIPHK